MLAMKPETKLTLGDDILIQGLSELDHYYAFNVKSGDHYRLNSSAFWVLQEIGSGILLRHLKKQFASFFRLDQETASGDLSEVLKYSIENHLVQEVTA